MSTFIQWLEKNPSKTGEQISERMMLWIYANQRKLLKAFPEGERAFCRVIDKMMSRMPPRWKMRLRYTRQKWFIVAPEVVFFGDFYFRNLRLLIEIDGSHHMGPSAQEKDFWRSKLISAFRDTKVARISNCQILEGDMRETEQWLIDQVCSILPDSIGRNLMEDYRKMQRKNPHIYQAEGVYTVYAPKRA